MSVETNPGATASYSCETASLPGTSAQWSNAVVNSDESSSARDVPLLDMEAGGDVGRFTYQIPVRNPYPGPVAFARKRLFWSFIIAVFFGSGIFLDIKCLMYRDLHSFVEDLKMVSVPLVSLLFTWFHVWLALQMMFYPIDFYGIPKRPIVPQWLDLPINGWQGIIPRKAGIMATRCCDKMIGNICTIDEFAERIDPDHFWANCQDVFGSVCTAVLEKIMIKRWPALWEALPANVREELTLKVCEETKNSFLPAMVELKGNINSILDIRKMAAEALTNDPELMVNIFRGVAKRELSFITHVAAVMGFVLGCVQAIIYAALKSNPWPYTDYVLLPVSGLILGYFTNWLALKMTFSPIFPHMYLDNTVNFQGVFLKRQAEAADQMATAICEKVVDAQAMMDYMFRSSAEGEGANRGVDKVLEIYTKHINNSLDTTVGRLQSMMPYGLSKEMQSLRQDVIDLSLEQLPQHTKKIEEYMDQVMQIKETLSYRLQHIQPDEFEDIIHPIFQADEWILLAVGGILGVIIGLVQAWALQSISA